MILMINFANKSVLGDFVQDNIADYNIKPSDFSAKNLKAEFINQFGREEEAEYTDSEIGVYLAERMRELLNDPARKSSLNIQLNALTGTKTNIDIGLMTIANTEIVSLNDLKNYYQSLIMKRIQETYESDVNLRTDIFRRILAYNTYAIAMNQSTQNQVDYIKNDLKCAVEKGLYLALANGFTNRRIDISTGTKVANEGDSAQFLFLARAVLAGYNCSNVDVRSSRYDAVIDYNGHLLRVQIKGISGKSISLKDRDRGGAGIDPTAKRNQGRYISSNETDLYVAVDKQFGICYIIPTIDIDAWVVRGMKTVSVSHLEQYKENWEKISETANRLFP